MMRGSMSQLAFGAGMSPLLRARRVLVWLALGSLTSCRGAEREPEALLGPEVPSRGCQGRNDCTVEGRFAEPGCVAVTDGFGVCVDEAPAATEPSDYASMYSPEADQCDGTRPCESGSCYWVVVYPSGYCTPGVAGPPTNVCLSDLCASDDDCGGGWCAPRGVGRTDRIAGGFIRQCFAASCRVNADCTARAGGVCAFVSGLCVPPEGGGFQTYEPSALACVYPGGCVGSNECPLAHDCRIVDGEARCVLRD